MKKGEKWFNKGVSSPQWKLFGLTPPSATKRIEAIIVEVQKTASENAEAPLIISDLESIKRQAAEALLVNMTPSENIIPKASKNSPTGMGDEYHDKVSVRNRSVSAID